MGESEVIHLAKIAETLEKLVTQLSEPPMPKALLSVDELVTYTGIGKTKINNLVREKKIPFFYEKEEDAKKGMVRFSIKEIDLWIKQRIVKAS